MFYGHKNGIRHRHKSFSKGISGLVEKHFHQKYLRSFLWIMISGQLLFLLPLFYYMRQNYAFFSSIALQNRPQILQDLDRELGLLGLIALISIVSSLFIGSIVVQQHTKKILDPLEQIKNKLNEFNAGQFSEFKYQSDKEPEFNELVSAFSALSRKLLEEQTANPPTPSPILKIKTTALDEVSISSDSKHRAS